jgi:hypothetical protein
MKRLVATGLGLLLACLTCTGCVSILGTALATREHSQCLAAATSDIDRLSCENVEQQELNRIAARHDALRAAQPQHYTVMDGGGVSNYTATQHGNTTTITTP